MTPSPVIAPVVPVRATTAPIAPTPGPPAAGTALAAVAGLTVKGRAPKTGYTRDQFGQSRYDTDGNGCDTRNDILRRDLVNTDMKNACKVLAGILVPEPAPQPAPVPAPPAGATHYASCTAARAAGAAPIMRGEPGYASKLDRDNDGIALRMTVPLGRVRFGAPPHHHDVWVWTGAVERA